MANARHQLLYWHSGFICTSSVHAQVMVTSGQSDLTKTASLLQTDSSVVFARWRQYALPCGQRWRQCAVPCGLISATWWIRLNMCFHRFTTQTTNRSVQLLLHSSRQKVPMHNNWRPLHPKLPLSLGDLDIHLIYDFLGQSKPTIKMAWWSVQAFSHRWP